jgi:hypothetical protein
MPSPTRRSKSRSPNNRTRRARGVSGIFANDPVVQAMHRGNLLWGDIAVEAPASYRYRSRSPASRSPPMPRAPPGSPVTPPYSPINDAFEGYETPDLRRTAAIWENFPVVLQDVSSRGDRQIVAIKLHHKKFDEWRSTRTKNYGEAMEYDLFTELRLIHSLRKYPRLYTIMEPANDGEIVRIELHGPARLELRRARTPSPPRGAAGAAARARSPPRAAAAAAAGPRVPVLRKLNDITTHFPGVVVWSSVAGRAGESTYALQIRKDFGKKMAPAAKARVLADLEAALRASRFWSVLAPARGEFLRLEMRHD